MSGLDEATLVQRGLTAAEAEHRFATEGPNELPTARLRNLLQQAWTVVRQPMILLLLVAGSINFALAEPLDGAILMSFVVVVIAEGDRVPADAVLAEAVNLSVDESALTGESVPVGKTRAGGRAGLATIGPPGGDATPWVFSGTLVVRGRGIALVVGTGSDTELGKVIAARRGARRTP